MKPGTLLAGIALAFAPILPAQKKAVVLPASAENVEENASMFWLLSPYDSKQQLVIAASELKSLVGQRITGIQLRRNTGDNVVLKGGTVYVEVDMSTTTSAVSDVAEIFAQNHGRDRSQVFARNVHVAATNASPRRPAEWNSAYSVTLNLKTPFEYKGGQLCIESRTKLVKNAAAPWWPIDARNGITGGSALAVGTSCIPELPGTPAGADAATLVPGSTARLYLAGRSNALQVAVLMLGSQNANIDLSSFGAPGCNARVFAISFLPQLYTVYPPGRHGAAIARIPLPNEARFVGASVWKQWLVPTKSNNLGLSFSNAVHMRLGTSNQVSYAMVSAASATAASGDVTRDRYPVVRLLVQPTR